MMHALWFQLSLGRFNRSVGHGHNGAWQKFERGELDITTFYSDFSRDLSNAELGNKW